MMREFSNFNEIKGLNETLINKLEEAERMILQRYRENVDETTTTEKSYEIKSKGCLYIEIEPLYHIETSLFIDEFLDLEEEIINMFSSNSIIYGDFLTEVIDGDDEYHTVCEIFKFTFTNWKDDNLNEDYLNEMAMSRNNAIGRCISLGEPFINHFKIIYNEGLNSPNFNHHCHEMQVWWNKVSSIIFTNNNKSISDEELIGWFFEAGQLVSSFIEDEIEQDVYNLLEVELLRNRNADIKEIFKKIL